MSPLNGFNAIASVYDRLSRIVFGESIVNAQRHFLHRLPAKGKILILGGGTGEILPELFNSKPDTEVWFIEASSSMIQKARDRMAEHHRVVFIHGTEDSIPTAVQFDAVITNFFLDLFSPATLTSVIEKIDAIIRRDRLWLCADFCNRDHRLWKSLMLKVMYVFFRLSARIEAKSLPPWRELLQAKGYSIEEMQTFYRGFVCSLVLKKASVPARGLFRYAERALLFPPSNG